MAKMANVDNIEQNGSIYNEFNLLRGLFHYNIISLAEDKMYEIPRLVPVKYRFPDGSISHYEKKMLVNCIYR